MHHRNTKFLVFLYRHGEESIYCKGTASFLDEDWSCVLAASPEAEGHVKQIGKVAETLLLLDNL